MLLELLGPIWNGCKQNYVQSTLWGDTITAKTLVPGGSDTRWKQDPLESKHAEVANLVSQAAAYRAKSGTHVKALSTTATTQSNI